MKTTFTPQRTTEILKEVYSKASLDEVTDRILKAACEISNCVHGSFIRVCWKTRLLSIESTIGPHWNENLRAQKIPLGEGITGHCALTGQTYVCNDAQNDPNYIQLFPFIQSELAVPVEVEGKVWGIINLDGMNVHEYGREVVAEIEMFAGLIAAAIEYRLKNENDRQIHLRLAQAEKLSTAGELLAGIAHEVNNPLAAILGTSSMLATELTDPEHYEAAKLIEKQAQRAGNLIHQLLAFSRKSEGDNRKEDNLIDVVRESIEFVRPQLRLKRSTLEFTLPDGSELRSKLNRVQIQQVLVNLMTNAQHAIADRGEDGRISVSIESDQSNAYVVVQDNGTGMSREVRNKLFQPFFTTKEEGSGTGLGLSICQDIANRHLGTLECTSTEGRGSSFQFRLPLNEPDGGSESTAPAQLPSVPSEKSRSKSDQHFAILIVEDEDSIRWMLAKLFRKISEDVSVAASAEEALELCQQQDFDIIVSDMHMPGLSGVELFHRIHQQNAAQHPNFVLITGDISDPKIQQLASESEIEVVNKPFSPIDLLEHINRVREAPSALRLAA
tara:strand:- start:2623 stop:4293 length:1671 start_codon:yes stop_codon:yes gene_type:complete